MCGRILGSYLYDLGKSYPGSYPRSYLVSPWTYLLRFTRILYCTAAVRRAHHDPSHPERRHSSTSAQQQQKAFSVIEEYEVLLIELCVAGALHLDEEMRREKEAAKATRGNKSGRLSAASSSGRTALVDEPIINQRQGVTNLFKSRAYQQRNGGRPAPSTVTPAETYAS